MALITSETAQFRRTFRLTKNIKHKGGQRSYFSYFITLDMASNESDLDLQVPALTIPVGTFDSTLANYEVTEKQLTVKEFVALTILKNGHYGNEVFDGISYKNVSYQMEHEIADTNGPGTTYNFVDRPFYYNIFSWNGTVYTKHLVEEIVLRRFADRLEAVVSPPTIPTAPAYPALANSNARFAWEVKRITGDPASATDYVLTDNSLQIYDWHDLTPGGDGSSAAAKALPLSILTQRNF